MNTKLLIANTLKELGISPNLKGYYCIRTGIELALEDEEVTDRMVKKFYPAIAEKVGTTPSRVERAIRNSIETAFSNEHDNEEAVRKIFGNTINSEKGAPTNSQFILTLIDYIRIKVVLNED